MVNLENVKGFQWDAGNSRKSEDKHGVAQAEAEQVFSNRPLLLAPDIAHSSQEQRIHAMGKSNQGPLLHITFTIRRERVRVISARPMHKKEQVIYEKNT